jgi:hypothetical protein
VQSREERHLTIANKIPTSKQSPKKLCFGLLQGNDFSSVYTARLSLMFSEVLLQAPFHRDFFILQLHKPFSVKPGIKEISL